MNILIIVKPGKFSIGKKIDQLTEEARRVYFILKKMEECAVQSVVVQRGTAQYAKQTGERASHLVFWV